MSPKIEALLLITGSSTFITAFVFLLLWAKRSWEQQTRLEMRLEEEKEKAKHLEKSKTKIDGIRADYDRAFDKLRDDGL